MDLDLGNVVIRMITTTSKTLEDMLKTVKDLHPIHNMEPSRTQRREEMELGINLVWTLQGTGGRGIRGTLQRVWMTPLD